ncbi:heterokaryon incompatibility protein-domain-containing protein [Bisporella sp. PMI_857]|nr:heterokaryon incompatibility protein-domain-containing protein [Bisporella sp. PMI_857]
MMQLCLICLNFDRLFGDGNRWHVDVRDDLTLEYSLEFESQQLKRSAESGCATCSVVLSGLQLMSRKSFIFEEWQPHRGRFILQADSPLEVEVIDPQKNEPVRIQYYTLTGSKIQDRGPQWAPFGAANDVPSVPSVARCSSIILDWITNCQNHHKACAVERPQLVDLPSRMLDIDPQQNMSVRLIQTQKNITCLPHPFYATLSHCWGTVNVIQTTKETLMQRIRGIDWESLPRTFQDAITIVRALKIRFIWIDSLCIIQDDDQDWKLESARMATIYSNSYVNIAATGASDSRGGCLSPRSLKHVSRTFEIGSFPINPDITTDHAGPTVFVRPSFESIHHRYSTRSTYDTDLPDTKAVPLLSRAWVFQERHLAPRTIHFHPSEMVMECKSRLRCECTGLDKFVTKSRRNSFNLDRNSLDGRLTLDNWCEVVEEFSRLRLTRESDRLPALIGVATVFQASLKCGYLAGLWEHDIARGLLWDVTRYENTLGTVRRHKRSFAPSWSWASMVLETEGSGIIFPAGHDEIFEIDRRFAYVNTDMPVVVMDSNFGTPNKAIWIQGAVVTAISCALCEPVDGENVLILVFEQDVDDAVLITTIGMKLDVTGSTAESPPVEYGTTVYCIIVGSTAESDYISSEQVTYLCTCVLRMSLAIPDSLERIGVLDIREDTGIFQTTPEIALKLT